MLTVDRALIKEQNEIIFKEIKKPNTIFFDSFLTSYSKTVKADELPEVVKIPQSNKKLLSDDPDALEPALVIHPRDFEEQLYYKDYPIWRNNSADELTISGFGLINGDKTKPVKLTLFDTAPHMFIGGATGHGKSVSANDFIMKAAMDHAPWNAQFYFIDPKVVELAVYANQPNPMKNVSIVAATPDTGYALSMLKYLVALMDERNAILAKYGVKNIKEFRSVTGLSLPMLVIFIDELMALIEVAGKDAGEFDKYIFLLASKGRNSGFRLVMASQVVVTALSKATWSNIATRVALGCSKNDSVLAIGNEGANKNFKQRGKVTINTNPSAGDIKDNVYAVCPFLPSEDIGDIQLSIHNVMKVLYEKAELLGYDSGDPMTKFVIEEELFSREFKTFLAEHTPTFAQVYLGEPSYVNKSGIKFAGLNLLTNSEFETAEGKNILIVTESSPARYNILNIILDNFIQMKKKEDMTYSLYANSLQALDIVHRVNPEIIFDKETEVFSFESLFNPIVTRITLANILVATDYRVFNKTPLNEERIKPFYDDCKGDVELPTELDERRLKYMLDYLVFGGGSVLCNVPVVGAMKNQKGDYTAEYQTIKRYILGAFLFVKSQLVTDRNVKIVEKSFRKSVNFVMALNEYDGFDRGRPNDKNVNYILDTLNKGPIYNVFTIATAGKFENQYGALDKGFKYLLTYLPPSRLVNGMKIADGYPGEPDKRLMVFTDLTTAEKSSVSIKFPTYSVMKKN